MNDLINKELIKAMKDENMTMDKLSIKAELEYSQEKALRRWEYDFLTLGSLEQIANSLNKKLVVKFS